MSTVTSNDYTEQAGSSSFPVPVPVPVHSYSIGTVNNYFDRNKDYNSWDNVPEHYQEYQQSPQIAMQHNYLQGQQQYQREREEHLQRAAVLDRLGPRVRPARGRYSESDSRERRLEYIYNPQ